MSSVELDHELNAIAEDFKKNVKLEDRKYRLKTYKECFIGSEAVDYLVSSGKANSREDAVALAQALQGTHHLFEHVTRDHQFADEYLFFRFLDEKERGSLSVDEATGEKINWSHFLTPPGGDMNSSGSLQPTFPVPDFEALCNNDIHTASQVWPMDEFNTTLLNNVHPANWVDPQPGSATYDLVVIGGGAAGLISAAGSAGVGAKVALIEA